MVISANAGAEAANLRKGRLTAADAARIFKTKYQKSAKTSKMLASKYGVTAKAIRDVWSLKTWTLITMPYWSEEDRNHFAKMPLTTLKTSLQGNGKVRRVVAAMCKHARVCNREPRCYPLVALGGAHTVAERMRLIRRGRS